MKKVDKPQWSQLAYERKKRGWTQAELAEKVGAASFVTVSRWERGTALPNPYYCQRLCEVFEKKNIEELGLIREETRPNNVQQPGQSPQVTAKEGDRQPLHQPSHQNVRNYRINKLSILDRFQIIITRHSEVRHSNLSPKDRLEDPYHKLVVISEARLNFASTVEALRLFNGNTAYERLPHVITELDSAEQTFDETEVRHTLTLLDNNKVWPHYVIATESFREYKKRTQDLVNYALQPLPPNAHRIMRLDRWIADDDSLEDDPETRQAYRKMVDELNAMLRAMNKRLRV